MPSRRSASLLAPFASALTVAALAACGANTDDLFGSVGGAGGAAATGSQSTGSQSTGAQSTGAQSTGSQSTGSQSTSSSASATGSSASTGSTTTSSTTGAGPFCGDGVVNQPQEQCDGADLGGHDCTDHGFVDPAGAACTGNCKVDYAGCAAMCGNGTVEPGEQCDDGNTNAFDACSNTCVAQGTLCGAAIPITLSAGTMTIGADTSGSGMYQSQGCQNATGPELIYAVKAAQAGFLTVWTDPVDTDYDALVYVRGGSSCANGTELACGDNEPQEPDLFSIPVAANQVVHVFVDGFQGASGHFGLHLDLSAGTCADPVPILSGDQGFPVDAKGTTVGQGADGVGTCGGAGPDVVYAVTRLSPGTVNVDTTPASATFKTITHARTTCDSVATEVACNNNLMSNSSSISFASAGAAPPTYVWVDGGVAQQGAYTVSFSP